MQSKTKIIESPFIKSYQRIVFSNGDLKKNIHNFSVTNVAIGVTIQITFFHIENQYVFKKFW